MQFERQQQYTYQSLIFIHAIQLLFPHAVITFLISEWNKHRLYQPSHSRRSQTFPGKKKIERRSIILTKKKKELTIHPDKSFHIHRKKKKIDRTPSTIRWWSELHTMPTHLSLHGLFSPCQTRPRRTSCHSHIAPDDIRPALTHTHTPLKKTGNQFPTLGQDKGACIRGPAWLLHDAWRLSRKIVSTEYVKWLCRVCVCNDLFVLTGREGLLHT